MPHDRALAAYPPTSNEQPSNVGVFGLAAAEVYLADDITATTGGLLPHHFTLTPASRSGILSVALAVIRFRRSLPVRKQLALCCPDFPPATEMTSDETTFYAANIHGFA